MKVIVEFDLGNDPAVGSVSAALIVSETRKAIDFYTEAYPGSALLAEQDTDEVPVLTLVDVVA